MTSFELVASTMAWSRSACRAASAFPKRRGRPVPAPRSMASC